MEAPKQGGYLVEVLYGLDGPFVASLTTSN